MREIGDVPMQPTQRVAIDTDKELVRILVVNGKLQIPEDQHRIYFYSPGGPTNPTGAPPTPGRATELAWLAFGLPQGYKVRIQAKPQFQGLNYMRRDLNVIPDDGNPVFSGTPISGPGVNDPPQWWIYDITLLDSKDQVLDSYDPEVIIDKDP